MDAAGAKVIGIDILFLRPAPGDNEQTLIDAIRRARAQVVLGAGDERIGLTSKEIEFQKALFAQAGRPAGYVNLATERDWVVRFKAQPGDNSAFPKSFAELLAESAGRPSQQGAPAHRLAADAEGRVGHVPDRDGRHPAGRGGRSDRQGGAGRPEGQGGHHRRAVSRTSTSTSRR